MIIVNADDLGYSAHRDRGIFNCFKRGVISAASLIVNGPTSYNAAKTGQTVGLYMGLHLNLTEGYPISKTAVPLTNSNGIMYYKESFWKQCSNANENFSAAIVEETTAQIEKFRQLVGYYPKHIDGHQHIHIIPKVAKLVAPIFHKYGVLSVRIPDEDVENYTWLSDERYTRYQNRYIDAIKSRLIYKKYNIKAPECFVGLGICGRDMTHDRIENALKESFGIVEVMTHPGLVDKCIRNDIFDDDFDISLERLAEHNQLDYFKDKKLISWDVYSSTAHTPMLQSTVDTTLGIAHTAT